jgi:hypothetical protein
MAAKKKPAAKKVKDLKLGGKKAGKVKAGLKITMKDLLITN